MMGWKLTLVLMSINVQLLATVDPPVPEIIVATIDGNAKRVQQLVDNGADVNAKDHLGHTAIMTAAMYSRNEIAIVLLQKQANVNLKDKSGRTALMWAARTGSIEIVGQLLDADADVNSQSARGETALLEASSSQHPESVKLLIEHGASVDHVEKIHAWSALIVAAQVKDSETVRILLESGANRDHKDRSGKRAIDYACEERQSDACLILSYPRQNHTPNKSMQRTTPASYSVMALARS